MPFPKTKSVSAVCLLLTTLIVPAFSQSQPAIWYKQPARNWNEALPVGNGRLGAMVFGKVDGELLQLNEETLWSGGPVNRNPNPGVAKYLPEVREALFREDYAQAAKLTQQIQGLYTEAYQPLGDLLLKQDLTGTSTEYYRDLNINNATATTRFIDQRRNVYPRNLRVRTRSGNRYPADGE